MSSPPSISRATTICGSSSRAAATAIRAHPTRRFAAGLDAEHERDRLARRLRRRRLRGRHAPQPAVTVEAGAIWGQVYDAVTTKGGRYVQGGGCLTVGVAGLIQGGGFGSFSKGYGMARGEPARSRNRHRRRRGADRQRLHQSGSVLGAQGRRRRQLRRRDAAHLAHARAAGIRRRGDHDDQGDLGRGVSPADRQDRRLLWRGSVQSPLGRADRLSARQYSFRSRWSSRARPAAGAGDLAPVPRRASRCAARFQR